MTGNHPGRSGNPAKRANPGLDQLAAQIRNDRVGRNPVIVELEHIETQLLDLFAKVGAEHVEPEQAGATMLILGQLFNDLVSKLPEDQQYRAPAIIVNLLRMLGQRLYTGDVPSDELRCPFPLATGKPCSFKPTYTMGGTLTTVMRGHVALHHPGEVWPPADVDEDQADEVLERAELVTCDTCGIPVDLEGDDSPNAGVITHAGVQCIRCARPDSAQAELIAREQQQLVHLVDQHRDETAQRGVCQACGAVQELTTENLIASHAIGSMLGWPTASPHECAGSGQPPLPTGIVRVDERRAEDPGTRECRECHFDVPVIVTADGVITLSHPVDGTPFECPGSGEPPVPGAYRDAGMSDALVDERPFDGSPFENVRTFHPDGTVTHHDDPTNPNRPAPSGRFEPGFDADGNINEISIVTDDGQRADVIGSKLLIVDDPNDTPARPRVPAEECRHPRHSRMHLPGGERCLDCGTADPDGRDGA